MIIDNKSCDNCVNRRGYRCKVAGFGCETQRKWPSEECDEDWSGWELKVTKWDKIKEMLHVWIMSASVGIVALVKYLKPKTPDNKLTKNELDD